MTLRLRLLGILSTSLTRNPFKCGNIRPTELKLGFDQCSSDIYVKLKGKQKKTQTLLNLFILLMHFGLSIF